MLDLYTVLEAPPTHSLPQQLSCHADTDTAMLITFKLFLGNHAFAIVCGKECYENMAKSFEEVFKEINTLISEGEISVDGVKIKLEFFLGSDYKVLVTLLFLKNPQNIISYIAGPVLSYQGSLHEEIN